MPDETVLDGEIVALNEQGRPSFHTLQNYASAGAPLQFYVFDFVNCHIKCDWRGFVPN